MKGKFCLIGERLNYSFSAEIHKLMGFDYELLEVSHDKFENFIQENSYDGYNVTIPYKKEIVKYIENLSQEAKKIGCVNTVKIKDGKSFGYNTDYFGVKETFKRKKISVLNKNILILGTGGTSNTVEYFCKNNGAIRIVKVGRNKEINYKNVYDICKDTQIIVNTTPLGMSPYESLEPVELIRFKNIEFVFDCVYNPFKTKLLKKADEMSIENSNGLFMLVVQALESERIWTDDKSVYNYESVYETLLKKLK